MIPVTFRRRGWLAAVSGLAVLMLVLSLRADGQTRGQAPAGRGGRAVFALTDPVPQDPVLKGAIDLHAHQDPDSSGPSYTQAARSIDAIDLYTRAKAAGMRGFVIKQHLDQTAGLAYYIRRLHPDLEVSVEWGRTSRRGRK